MADETPDAAPNPRIALLEGNLAQAREKLDFARQRVSVLEKQVDALEAYLAIERECAGAAVPPPELELEPEPPEQ